MMCCVGMPKLGMPKPGMPKSGMPKTGMPKMGMPKMRMPICGMPIFGMPKILISSWFNFILIIILITLIILLFINLSMIILIKNNGMIDYLTDLRLKSSMYIACRNYNDNIKTNVFISIDKRIYLLGYNLIQSYYMLLNIKSIQSTSNKSKIDVNVNQIYNMFSSVAIDVTIVKRVRHVTQYQNWHSHYTSLNNYDLFELIARIYDEIQCTL